MPHFNEDGDATWLCQRCAMVYTDKFHSTWVDRGTELAATLGCHGNVCDNCLPGNMFDRALERVCKPEWTPNFDRPISLHEHCRRESGLDGPALERYINRHYGHG